MKPCEHRGCGGDALAKGLCSSHYYAMRRRMRREAALEAGHAPRKQRALPERVRPQILTREQREHEERRQAAIQSAIDRSHDEQRAATLAKIGRRS